MDVAVDEQKVGLEYIPSIQESSFYKREVMLHYFAPLDGIIPHHLKP